MPGCAGRSTGVSPLSREVGERWKAGTPKPRGADWSRAREDMRKSSVAALYTAVNPELRTCVCTSLRLDERECAAHSGSCQDPERWRPLPPARSQRSPPCGRGGRAPVRPFLGHAPGHGPGDSRLLELDRRPGAFELRLGLVGLLLGDPLEHRLGRRVDQVLGLLQAEAGERADLLDDLDLLVAGRGQDDVELGLLLLLGRGGGGGGGTGRDGDRGCRGHAEGVLELLDEVRELQKGHPLECLEEVIGGKLGHCRLSPSSWVLGRVGRSVRPDYSASVAAPPSDSSSLSRSAAVIVATWRSGAASRTAVRCRGAWSMPARRASTTSRDWRVASWRTESASRTLPSSTPPLTTRAGWVRANSASSLAAWTTSPCTNATAVGPSSNGTRSS